MAYWLMKTEPDVFSFADLMHSNNATTAWDGIRNYQARNLMRDEFREGDLVLIYHSRIKDPEIVGIAEVVKEAYPDETALDPKEKYFDEKSAKIGESRWCKVDVKAKQKLKSPVKLSQMRGAKELKDMMLLKKGMRLSIQPVSPGQWSYIKKIGNPENI